MSDSTPPADEVLTALSAVSAAAQRSIDNATLILQRAEQIRNQRADSLPYREIVRLEDRPLIVELLTSSIAELSEAGSRWRREEARALHREGLSMEKIAELFGVTRQRISTLIQRTGSGQPQGSDPTETARAAASELAAPGAST